ncbi:hypothetical protein [Gemmatimonas sp.]
MKLTKAQRKARAAEHLAALQRRITHLEGQLGAAYYHAIRALDHASVTSSSNRCADGVLLSLHTLHGEAVFDPVVIPHGLQDPTIAALKAEMTRAFELATNYPVPMPKPEPA